MKRMPDGEPKLSENQMFVGRANIQKTRSGEEYIAAHPDYPIIERPIISPRRESKPNTKVAAVALSTAITALGMEGCFSPTVTPTPTPEAVVSPTPQEGLSFTSEPAQLESFFEGLGVGLKSRCAEVVNCVSKEVPMVGSDNYTAFKIVGLEDSKNTPIDVYMFLGKDGKTETKMVTWLQNPNNPAGVYTGQEVIITENGLEFKKDAQGNYVPFGEFDMQGGKLTKLSITAPNGESYDAVMNGQGDATLIGYYTGEASPTPTPPPPEAPTVTPTEAPAAVSDMTKEELGEYSDGIKFDAEGKHWEIVTKIPGKGIQDIPIEEFMEMIKFKEAMPQHQTVRIQINYYEGDVPGNYTINHDVGFVDYDGTAYNLNVNKDFLQDKYLDANLLMSMVLLLYQDGKYAENIDPGFLDSLIPIWEKYGKEGLKLTEQP